MDETNTRNRRKGWILVATQVVVLLAAVLLPPAEHWSTPEWLLGVSSVVTMTALGIIVVASFRLGKSLAVSPEPRPGGALQTQGLYAAVRHPIYSAVLLLVIGVAVRSGNIVGVGLVAVAIAFFTYKARWEELRLTAQMPEYAEYAARVPRFVPAPWRRWR